jgi:acyl carrier protein
MGDATFERLQVVINRQIGVDTDDIRPDSRLVEDLNMTDLDLVETMQEIEMHFSVVISDEDRASFLTVSDLVHFIDAYHASQEA